MGVLIEGKVVESDWETFVGGESYGVRLYQDGHWTFEELSAPTADREVALPPEGQDSFVVGGDAAPTTPAPEVANPPVTGAP